MTTLASNKRRLKCPVCDRTIERKSRQQIYCSDKCMRKGNYARKAGSGELLGHDSALVRDPPKFSSADNVLQWPKSGSSLSANGPINLLGGGSWKWSRRGRIDIKTLSKIRWCEVGGELLEPSDE
jgi:hypothetical protein